MKWKFAASIAFGFLLVLGIASGVSLFGQQSGNPFQPGLPTNGQLPPGYSSPPMIGSLPGAPTIGNGQRMVPYTFTSKNAEGNMVASTVFRPEEEVHRLNASHQILREAQSKLRSPDATDSDKKEARESIGKYLKEEFERDQKFRREQVERLEEQVAKLRKQLDKREESQSKIIELRMQLLENEAEGLAFPEGFNELYGHTSGPPVYSPYAAQPNGQPYQNGAPRSYFQPPYNGPYPQSTPPNANANSSMPYGYPQPSMRVPQQKSNAPKEKSESKVGPTEGF